jgi:hypothetical protein
MNPIRLHSLRQLTPFLLSVLLLSAVPLYAQGTPAPSPDASSSPSATLFATIASDVFRFDSDQAELVPEQPGVVRLTVAFTTTDLPSNFDMVSFGLRTTVDDVYTVVSSTVDGQPATPFTTGDRRGYSWAIPDSISSHVLVADLLMNQAVTRSEMALSVQHIEVRSPVVLTPLSEATISQMAAAYQEVITPTATITPTTAATTPSTATATATSVLAPATTSTAPATISTATAAPIPTLTPAAIAPATPMPSDPGGGSNRLVPLLLGGLFLLAALAIGGLLLMRRRQPRAPLAASPAPGRAAAPPLPPVGAETVTGVLMPVYLQLAGDTPQNFAINETPFAIGRDPANSLPIDETFPGWQTVSRHHALISRHERGYVIEDLGSQNGVRVNGRLTPKNLLRNGWQVSVGGVAFRFVDETESN